MAGKRRNVSPVAETVKIELPKLKICGICAMLATMGQTNDPPRTIYHEDKDCIIFGIGADAITAVIGIWRRHGEIDRLHKTWLRERTLATAEDRFQECTVFGLEISKDHHLCCEVKLGG